MCVNLRVGWRGCSAERGPEVGLGFLQLSFLGLEQLVTRKAETLVLVGDRACSLVTEFIFNEFGFVTLVSQLKKKKKRKTCPVYS